MVVSRRSATRCDKSGGAGAGAPGKVDSAIAPPQSPQNRLPWSTTAPHAGQTSDSAPPQSLQNRLPSGLSAAHEGHETVTRFTPLSGVLAREYE
jgi:hypothetical protein